jgi:hypothetical protein
MYLMDHIIEIAHEVRNRNAINHPVMGIYPVMEDKLKGCPRFLFDENSIHTAVELTLGRPKVLREIMEHIRIPYPRMWVEWPESGRKKLRDTFSKDGDQIDTPLRPLPTKLGFLLECDEKGRKGTATWAWTNTHITKNDPPNIAVINPYFDLDACYKQGFEREFNFLQANLANIWRDNPIQQKALLSIWETAQHVPSEWGLKYLTNLKIDKYQLNHFYADVYGEYIMIWAIMILLTSSRKILDYVKVDMSKLNKIREKKKEAPRLDHTIVSLHISKEMHIHQKGVPLGFTRKSPRVHMVSSYPNHRGDKHWVVQPFSRGKGEVISRHVHVKL